MTDRLMLPSRYRRMVEELLREHVPEAEVWAYGSRINGRSHEGSDLDLVLRGPGLEPLGIEYADLTEAFRESNIPILVQAHDWARLPEAFHDEIERDYVVVQEGAAGGGWRTAAVEDITEKVAMGPFGSSIKVDTFVPEGVPVITGQHLHGSRVDDSRGFNFITEEHAERLSNANVVRGDIVLTHRGTIGQVALVPEASKFDRYIVSQSQFYLRCDREKVIPEFLTMYFKSREGQHQLLANSAQVGVPSIAQPVTYVRTIEVPLPPLEEQRAIARVLGALDDKIELNRRLCETLEEMARALFRSWFVDFDPVRAKAEGRPSGLPPDLDALFPDSFVDSELGEIPKGWEVLPAGEAMTVCGGSTPSTKEPSYWGGEHCFATPKDLSKLREPILSSTARHLTEAGVERIRSGLLPPGTVLLSSRAPIGYLAVTETPVAINQGIVAMACDGPIGALYALHWTGFNMPAIEIRADGTTFAEISKSSFREIPFLVPTGSIHAAWDSLVAPLYERVASNAHQSNSIAEQRDALLPRLMSGELACTP